MKIDIELKHYHKNGDDYYVVKHYFVYDSGNRYCYFTCFITRNQYEKLGGK